MATASAFGSSHLGVTENQKRWLVVGIALNKILIPHIRPFVEQGINTEYNNLKISHNIHGQSTSGRLQRWPGRKVLKYENINGNNAHPKLSGGRFNYSLFDCRVTSHVDFARLYVENYMAHFTAFDDHCDASAVLSLLGGVPVFSAAAQIAAGDVRMGRNDWAHCVFSKWDQVKFQQSFIDMEHLVRVMGLPTADEGKLLGELKDWETKGTHLCMNSPVDPALLQLVQQELKSFQDSVKNMPVEFEEEKKKVQHELQNIATSLEEMELRIHTVETGQQNLQHRTGIIEGRIKDFEGDVNQRMERLESNQQSTESCTMLVEHKVHHLQEDVNQRMVKLESSQQSTEAKVHHLKGDVQQRVERLESSQQSTESRTMLVEHKVHHLQEQVEDLTLSKESNVSTCQDNSMPAAYPEKLVKLIRRDYKGAVLCPFPWCEDDLQLELSNIFTRLKIISKKKERARPTDNIVNMTDVFKPHEECNKPRVVLIEGQPGMGKTTYCQKLAYDWSVEDISPEASFPKVKMLLLLKCRDMKNANIEEVIDDQLLPQDADKKEKENFFQFIRCNQSRILLVLDGLDELREDLFQSLLPLIQGKVFPNTFLMLTARHEAGTKVRRYCDTLLEIVGYTDEDADSYITKYFSNHEDPSLADKMIEKLKHDKQLRELAANPLNTALLCLLCEDTRGIFPSNRTRLYDELVTAALRRYFARKDVALNDNHPIEACVDQLNQLGKMALEALLKGQLAFSSEELKGQEFLEFGFLSREASTSKIRPKPCYAFTHKTLQEYFAAFHLARQLLRTDKQGREILLAQLSPVLRYEQVWSFLMGMLTAKSARYDVAASLVESLCDRHFTGNFWDDYYDYDDYDNHDDDSSYYYDDDHDYYNEDICDDGDDYPYDCDCDYFVVRCVKGWENMEPWEKIDNKGFLSEVFGLIDECGDGNNEPGSFQKELMQALAHHLPLNCITFHSNIHSYLKMEYFKSNPELKRLDLNSGFTELEAIGIAQVLQQPNCKFTKLVIQGQVSGTLAATTLTRGLHSNNSLRHIDMGFTRVGDAGAKGFADALKSSSALKCLRLDSNDIGDSGAAALVQALQFNSTVKILSLRNNTISDPGEVPIHASKSSCTLTLLDVGCNRINDSGAAHLAPALQSQCTALTHLNLDHNMISDSGVQAFAKALESDWKLTHLDLSFNSIGDTGVKSLANALQSNCNLTKLDLSHNSIGDAGAESIANALQSHCNLTNLNLSHNSIGNAGAKSIANALQSNCNLTNLNLYHNALTNTGAESLANALQSNCNLINLNLRHNAVGDAGAKSIANALQSNCNLTDLNLRHTSIGDAGAESLAIALQSNCNLINLDLSRNMLTASVVTALAEALQSNTTLKRLDLSENALGDLGAIAMENARQLNNTLTFLDLRRNKISNVKERSSH
ncbi:hypothetical protein ACROYT_G002736 [Oculina patagonica]